MVHLKKTLERPVPCTVPKIKMWEKVGKSFCRGGHYARSPPFRVSSRWRQFVSAHLLGDEVRLASVRRKALRRRLLSGADPASVAASAAAVRASDHQDEAAAAPRGRALVVYRPRSAADVDGGDARGALLVYDAAPPGGGGCQLLMEVPLPSGLWPGQR